MSLRRGLLWAIAMAILLSGAGLVLSSHPQGSQWSMGSASTWQRMASPGELSEAHSFLEHDCRRCHTPVRGVTAGNCIVCHANEEALLARQPTAFHGTIGSCTSCHAEHLGVGHRLVGMDHRALASIGLRMIRTQGSGEATQEAAKRIAGWMEHHRKTSSADHDGESGKGAEGALDCANCHSNQDRHLGYFGRDCANCHRTNAWSIALFVHPAASSVDCSECHKPPPSHLMEHFRMISMRVARQEHATVNECHLCHQTTSWNDIKGVGWYKHH